MKKGIYFSCLLVAFASCAQEKPNDVAIQEVDVDYTFEKVVDDVDIPWGMTWLPDGAMLYTEKSGELIHVKNGEKTSIKNVPKVIDEGQGGLLDIELHPKYEENGWIYMTYSSDQGEENGAHTALVRAKLQDMALVNVEELYMGSPKIKTGHHYGSRIAFDNEGYLYFSIGERGKRDINPQDITRDGGKIYRLHDDGRIPEDNPFVDDNTAKKAIYSYGHRNPQGMDKHPETGKIWIHEHGPKGGDEINIVKKGANFGWPVITYGRNYSGTVITEETAKEGMEQPIYYWLPSIAPCGMTFVTGDTYPELNGNLLVGSLKFAYLELVELDGTTVTGRKKLAENMGRLRNVAQAPDGYIYFSVEDEGIYKIKPKNE